MVTTAHFLLLEDYKVFMVIGSLDQHGHSTSAYSLRKGDGRESEEKKYERESKGVKERWRKIQWKEGREKDTECNK